MCTNENWYGVETICKRETNLFGGQMCTCVYVWLDMCAHICIVSANVHVYECERMQ